MHLNDAFTVASWVRGELEPACEQIVIGGSVRRRAPLPGDLELICMPKPPGPPVFGQKTQRGPLEVKLAELVQAGQLAPINKNGDRYKNFYAKHPTVGTMALDLFICRPPASWGCLLVLRTGPAEFSRWLVTKHSQRGGCPDNMKFEDGQLWRDEGQGYVVVDTPNEEAVFAALGVTFRPPHQRQVLVKWSKGVHA